MKHLGWIIPLIGILIVAFIWVTPHSIEVENLEDNRLFGESVTIEPSSFLSETTIFINDENEGETVTLEESGMYTVEVVSQRLWTEASETYQIEIDKTPPEEPQLEADKEFYIESAIFDVEVQDGVEFDATLDGEPYQLGETITEGGEHELVVKATKEINGKEATTTHAFYLESEQYSQEELDYFYSIAIGAEYGPTVDYIRKWEKDIQIGIHGSPDEESLNTLEEVIADLNALTETIDITILENADETASNIEIYFVPVAILGEYIPGYRSGNWGYFTYYTNQDNQISDAVIGIGTDRANQRARNHLIREEVTQALGLANDRNTYSDSIFHAEYAQMPQEFSDIDESVIELLYKPYLYSGMTREEIAAIFE